MGSSSGNSSTNITNRRVPKNKVKNEDPNPVEMGLVYDPKVNPSEYDREMEERFNNAYGAVIGAFIGDALGAPLEFQTGMISERIIEKIMNLEKISRGCHGTAPGQITDDSELAMCLAHGLAKGNGKMNVDEITRYYGKWLHESQPFDVGVTTSNSLKYAKVENPNSRFVQKKAGSKNKKSQSNGSLMRITPLCVFTHRLTSIEDISTAVIEDTSLTHPSTVIQTAAIAYCIAVRSLINTKGNRKSAYNDALAYVSESEDEEVMKWFKDIENEVEIGCHKKMGWAKIGFHYAFYYLKKDYNYWDAMRDILKRGGDTDTNAAIVGGMLGAATGFDNLPEKLKKECLNVDTTIVGVKRPPWLVPKNHIHSLILQIFHDAPQQLEIIYSQ